MKKVKFTVVRERWLRGGRNGKGEEATSYLRNADGDQCCLGFYARELGYSKSDIAGAAIPKDVPRPNLFPKEFLSSFDPDSPSDNNFCSIVAVNDDEGLTDKKREKKLKKLFKKVGLKIRFRNRSEI